VGNLAHPHGTHQSLLLTLFIPLLRSRKFIEARPMSDWFKKTD
jgi:hypothetical protein